MSDKTTDVSASSGEVPDPRREFIDGLSGMRLGQRYLVSHVLGMGGMGVVVAATNTDLDQRVAIKLMFPEHAQNPVLAARFAREARLAAKVESPHLVRVFDVGKHETGVPYLVMEMLTGKDLGAELASRGPLPIDEAVDYVVQAALGVAEIHALGYVHRDLKPSNLFLAHAAGTTTIKILDFGISKEAAPQSKSLTATESILGTPGYMSPEQIKATKDADLRSDIWALGVILYELLTARGPFPLEGDSLGELFATILFVEPTPPRTHRPDLPLELEAAIMRCLMKDRTKRFQTVRELAEALLPFGSPTARVHADSIRRLTQPRDGSHAAATAPTAVAVTPVQPLSDPRAGRVPAAQADKSLASSTRSIALAQGMSPAAHAKRGLLLGLGGGALLVGGVLAFVAMRGTTASVDAQTDSAAASVPSNEVPAHVEPSASVAPVAPSASASVAPSSNIAAAPVAAPSVATARPKTTTTTAHAADTHRPATATTPPATTSSPSLVLDRK